MKMPEMSLLTWQKKYGTEKACSKALFKVRWPDGFYCPQFPSQFGSIEDARAFCQDFFEYYNKEHRHSGIGLVTPEQLHHGFAQDVYDQRCFTLKNASDKNPERFRGKKPQPPALPKAAWINKPKQEKPDVIRA
jgi:putative transposase